MNEKIILHVCCGPCSTHAINELKKEYEVILFFSNSNIFPEKEYLKRLDAAKKTADHFGIDIFQDKYDHESWLDFVKGLENEPESGNRCDKCFEYNLSRTSIFAGSNKFTTTLTISPHKDSKKIFSIGNLFPNFVEKDFKKMDGFNKSIKFSKQLGLYRQNYCGCEFSMRK